MDNKKINKMFKDIWKKCRSAYYEDNNTTLACNLIEMFFNNIPKDEIQYTCKEALIESLNNYNFYSIEENERCVNKIKSFFPDLEKKFSGYDEILDKLVRKCCCLIP